MYRKTAGIIFTLTVIVLLFNSFATIQKYIGIDADDVQLNIPNGFPKPLYNFSNNKLSPEVFALGRQLFYDPILSKDNTISCATCHQGFAAFAHIDHALSHGIDGKIGTRNVPALQNLIWKDTYMWDGSIRSLEKQPINPITNPIEMNETMEHVVQKLQNSQFYKIMFKKAFNDSFANTSSLLKALAQFNGLMISANSKYDQFVTGKTTFSDAEKNGLNLFKANCSNCHKEPLFTDNSYRNNGMLPDTNLNDLGRYKVTSTLTDKYKFKVPSLRNVAMTFPYMHDGRFSRLREVLDHYTSPQKFTSNTDVSLFKIAKLSENEKKDIIAFLLTLTDANFLKDKRFLDPNMN